MQIAVGILVLAFLAWGLTLKDKRGEYILRKRVLNTSLLCLLMLLSLRHIPEPTRHLSNSYGAFCLKNQPRGRRGCR